LLIDNGKKPNEPYNAALGFWLPPKTTYGNFQLKFMKIIQRLDQANRRIEDSFNTWNSCQTGGMLPIGALERHVFANEELVYMLRRAADELVSLIWCLTSHKKNGSFPTKIKIDCIGAVVAQNENGRHPAFSDHVELMSVLNDVSNAFKHSFINSDHTVIGADEPRVHALGLAYNKQSSNKEFYDVSLVSMIEKYNMFYRSCVSWLESYSARCR